MKKRLWVCALTFLLLTASLAGCTKDPAESGTSEPSTASDTASAEDSVPADESGEDDSGSMLIGTTAAPDESEDNATTPGTKAPGESNGKDNSSLATQTRATRPSGAPTIGTTVTKKPITLPKFSLDPDKKLVLCIDWDPKSSWVESWEKAFRACYDPKKEITIEYKTASPSMKASKLAIWKNAKQSPDAVYIKPEESWPTLINKGLARPIDGLTDLSAGFWEGVKGTMDGLKLNGKNYVAVSSAYSSGYVIYNPKVFKNAGLTDPRDLLYKDEWTYAKFEEYAKKLTRLNATDASKSTWGISFHYYEPFLFGGGKDLIEYKNGKWISNLNDKTIAASIEYLRKLGDTGNKYVQTTEKDMTTMRSMVTSGRVAMFVTAESPGLEFTNDEFNKGTLRYVPIPRYTDSKTYYVGGVVDGWLVCNGAKNPDAGMAFATAVRALGTLNLNVDAAADKEYPADQKYCNDYANSVVTVVPQQFRRLSGTIEYWDIYGGPVQEGTSWSATVAEWEPKIMEALSKE